MYAVPDSVSSRVWAVKAGECAKCPPGYDPVCYNGVPYPTTCHAQCSTGAGPRAVSAMVPLPPGKSCRDIQPSRTPRVPAVARGKCSSCPPKFLPVCWKGVPYPSPCFAQCTGGARPADVAAMVLLHPGASCSDVAAVDPDLHDITSRTALRGSCRRCPTDYAPVCHQGVPYPNWCFAQCQGGASYSDMKYFNALPPGRACRDVQPQVPAVAPVAKGECEKCPASYTAVCWRGLPYPNHCYAQCTSGAAPFDVLSMVLLPPGESCAEVASPQNIRQLSPVIHGDCSKCSREFRKPVCWRGKTYVNICFAQCDGFNLESGTDLFRGACGGGPGSSPTNVSATPVAVRVRSPPPLKKPLTPVTTAFRSANQSPPIPMERPMAKLAVRGNSTGPKPGAAAGTLLSVKPPAKPPLTIKAPSAVTTGITTPPGKKPSAAVRGAAAVQPALVLPVASPKPAIASGIRTETLPVKPPMKAVSGSPKLPAKPAGGAKPLQSQKRFRVL
jgi:hypothetical protein